MITKFRIGDKSIDFVEDYFDYTENNYTVIVGKNGTGKSSLLGAVIKQVLSSNINDFYRDSDLGFQKSLEGYIEMTEEPDMVIAVSTSPFDKFPLNKRTGKQIDEYYYLGLRDLISANFGLSYMSKITASLVEIAIRNPQQIDDITRVLGFLGYDENIEMIFSLSFSKGMILDAIRSDNFEEQIYHGFRNPAFKYFNKRFFLDDNDNLDREKIEILMTVCEKILSLGVGARCRVLIENGGIYFDHMYELLDKQDLIFLIQSGLLKLRDVKLRSVKSHRAFSIKDASSGEQSVILSILGIASKIKDNTIICIDEPEVCLHPQWQEKYIQLLISTFRMYKKCHFIIATHSPQIVSRLEGRNCYILSMESGEVRNAKDYINHSADFQLANIFESPGYKNEYLSRIALSTFAKVSVNKKIDEDDIVNYKILQKQSDYLDDNDPVNTLYIALKEMFSLYGRH